MPLESILNLSVKEIIIAQFFLAVLGLGSLGLRYLKLRFKAKKLSQKRPQQRRDEIYDAHKKARDLETLGYTGSELERVKNQLLATIEHDQVSEGDDSSESIVRHELSNETSAGKLFLTGIIEFGFFGIWSIGWGLSFALFLIPSVGDMWSWAVDPNYGIWTFTWRVIALLFGAIALIGLWIVPTIVGLMRCFAGLLMMIAVLFPSITLRMQSTKLNKIWKKYVLGE